MARIDGPEKPKDQSAELLAYQTRFYQSGSWYWLRDALISQGIDPDSITDQQFYDLHWSGWNDPFMVDWKKKLATVDAALSAEVSQ